MTERQLRESRSSHGLRQCRICLEGEEGEPVTSPCNCKGSIEYVHRACLKEYFVHRFKGAPRGERRRMKECLECEICKEPIRSLRVQSVRRCARCSELGESVETEDIFFVVIYLLLYVGFHVVGVIIIIQDSLLAKVIGSVWLTATVIAFNYGLYKLVRKLLTVREAQVVESPTDLSLPAP